MKASPPFDAVRGRFQPESSCADVERRLLNFVDQNGCVTQAQLLTEVERTVCSSGHQFHVRDLMRGKLQLAPDGTISLSRDGDNWLCEYGRPASDWATLTRSTNELRKWQIEALDAWAGHGRHGVVEAVTGTGKSRVGIEAIREALADDYSAVVVVPTVDLIEQWVRSLQLHGVPRVGRFGNGYKTSFAEHDVIVGTVQSLYGAPPTRPDGRVVLVADECHHYGSAQWKLALDPSYRRRLGLTATFERADDGINDLLAYFGNTPVYSIGFKQAIADGVVAPYAVKLCRVVLTPMERSRYRRADETVKDSRMRLIGHGFTGEPFGVFMGEVQEAAKDRDNFEVHDLAVRYLKAFSERADVLAGAKGKEEAVRQLAPLVASSSGAILFTSRKEATERFEHALNAEHVTARAIHSGHTRSERRNRLDLLRRGRIKALVAPNILDEGIDVPDIDLAIVLAGSASRRQMIQRMGRVLRLKEDRRKATFIVVYAVETTEDMNRSSGVEGNLDVILKTADSVSDI